MARIPLTGGYSLMEEGTHVLKITSAEYKEEFGKVKLTLQNSDGKKHFENFVLIDKDGNSNDAACGAFSALAKTALRDPAAEDVDVSELKGKYIKGSIVYREYEDKDGKTKKATQKESGTWWEEVTDDEIAEYESKVSGNVKESKPAAPATTGKPLDLKALLGR